MEKLVVNGLEYHNIFLYDQNSLLKYSVVTTEAWETLKKKNLSFLNTPVSVEGLSYDESNKYMNSRSKIILPILKGYSTFWDEQYTSNLNTEEILHLLKYSFNLLKIMNSNNVFHGDLFTKNIMINSSLNINFIDLETIIVDEYVSEENVYCGYRMKFEDIISKTRIEDKLSILEMYLYYLINGNFRCEISNYLNLNELFLPKNIEKELLSYINNKKEPSKDYYFDDIFDNLESNGYESHKLCTRRLLKKYNCY